MSYFLHYFDIFGNDCPNVLTGAGGFFFFDL